MPISLTHLSEHIFAAMVNSQREALLSLCGLTERADHQFVGNATELASCEAGLEQFGGKAFDGASRIDVVVRLRRDCAVAFELKLGTTRLTRTRIDDEWLRPCETSHEGRRWTGNMMAILDRRFHDQIPDDDLFARVNGERLRLTREWFVVARRPIIASWQAWPPNFSDRVRYLTFEDAIDRFGGRGRFNELVRRILDVDFYDEWIANAL